MSTIKIIQEIAEDAKKQYVGMDEAIDVIAMALISGTHALLVGPPGTAKTSLVKFFSKAMGLQFGKVLMNGDITRSDIFGPTDPVKLGAGEWTRMHSGLSVSNIYFVDEAGRGNAQTTNLLLEAMEEKTYTGEGRTVDLPLHCIFGATNTLFSRDQQAFFDRWTWRVRVNSWTSAQSVSDALSMSVSINPTKTYEVTLDEVKELSYHCLDLAKSAPDNVKQSIVALWADLKTKISVPISNRNWIRILFMAASSALYHDRSSISLQDLSVVSYLWSIEDDIAVIKSSLASAVRDEEKENFDDISNEMKTIASSILNKKLEYSDQVNSLGRLKMIQKKIKKNGYSGDKWSNLVKSIGMIEEMLTNYDSLTLDDLDKVASSAKDF